MSSFDSIDRKWEVVSNNKNPHLTFALTEQMECFIGLHWSINTKSTGTSQAMLDNDWQATRADALFVKKNHFL